ncbi:MAG: hypothetical protein D6715_03260 [Calditrichaeota bacterium]|nr:MAG: hypothetical protein D6715_03260 [Calditrichota bacterium]
MKSIPNGLLLLLVVLYLSGCGGQKAGPQTTASGQSRPTAGDTLKQGTNPLPSPSLERDQILNQLEQLVTELAEKERMLKEKEAELARLGDSLKTLQQALTQQKQALKQREIWMWSLFALAILGVIFAVLLIRSAQLKKNAASPPSGE